MVNPWVLLWQEKLWNREPSQSRRSEPNTEETIATARSWSPKPPFNEQKILQVGEALTTVETLWAGTREWFNIFDALRDITEVFAQFAILQHAGVIVRAARNRSLDFGRRLWSK